MFITLTINTTTSKKKVKFKKKRLNPARGWKRSLKIKRTSFAQRIVQWIKSFRQKIYRLDGQIAMY